MLNPKKRLHSKVRGMTLIEVLVAMAIMSLAMLGAMATQVFSLQNARVAENRSLAAMLGTSMIERMRANKPALQEYKMPAGSPGRISAVDLAEWNRDLQNNLPDGLGRIIIRGQNVEIRIFWKERDPKTRYETSTAYWVSTTL